MINLSLIGLNNESDINYGVMAYHLNHDMTDYKIYHVSNDYMKTMKYLHINLIYLIKNKHKINILFYHAININASLVSYHYIINAKLPCLHMILKNNTELCHFQGDHYLYKMIYKHLKFFQEYDRHRQKLSQLSKKELKLLYYKIYDQRTFGTKKSIHAKLLKYHKFLAVK